MRHEEPGPPGVGLGVPVLSAAAAGGGEGLRPVTREVLSSLLLITRWNYTMSVIQQRYIIDSCTHRGRIRFQLLRVPTRMFGTERSEERARVRLALVRGSGIKHPVVSLHGRWGGRCLDGFLYPFVLFLVGIVFG